MSSKRLQIKQALKTKLQAIQINNGYHNDLNVITYGYLPFSKVVERPAVCMISLTEPVVPLTSFEYTSGASRDSLDGWPIAIIGYVQSDKDEEALATEMENLIEDIVICLLADHTLGLANFVNNCYLINIDEVVDAEQNSGTVMITFMIKYDFDKGVP